MKKDLKILVRECARELQNSDAPETEAYELVKHALGFGKTDIILEPVRETDDERLSYLNDCVKKRKSGYPLQYILGQWDFYGRTFTLREGVLIPRCETEQIADECCRFLKNKKDKVVFDLCAGSGCIGLSAAVNNPLCKFFLFDNSEDAVFCQNDNLSLLSLDNVTILDYDIFYGFNKELLPFPDVILSNPPYVNKEDMENLQTEVRYEPETALYGGEDGLDFYRCIVKKWLPSLKHGGFFMLECAENQPERVLEMIENENLPLRSSSENDIFGVNRFVCGYRDLT
ncbi:MAG: peptide chain release factor N(5)-glutamine methyltransferase [Clostridiales bacterium]|nr:peptide chain release factor N(5)-glutamine methyltransferase [Clostridiales bacterium]